MHECICSMCLYMAADDACCFLFETKHVGRGVSICSISSNSMDGVLFAIQIIIILAGLFEPRTCDVFLHVTLK